MKNFFIKIINFFRGIGEDEKFFSDDGRMGAFKSLKNKSKNWLIRALIKQTEENIFLKKRMKEISK